MQLNRFLERKNNVKLSPTAIASFYDCPRKFFYMYIRKIPERPSPQKVRGQIVHKVLNHFFNYVNLADVKEENWRKLWEKFNSVLCSLLKMEWDLIGKEYADCFKDEVQKREYFKETEGFLDFYAAKLAFSLANKLVEMDRNSKWFEEELKRFFYPKNREFRLGDDDVAGIIDKTLSLFGEGIAIVDYKTSKCPLPHFIPESHIKQGKVYAFLWKKSFGELPRHISFYYLRTGESVYYPISESDIEEVKNDIENIRRKKPVIEEFSKNASRLCEYCDFYKMCWGDKEIGEVLKEANEKASAKKMK